MSNCKMMEPKTPLALREQPRPQLAGGLWAKLQRVFGLERVTFAQKQNTGRSRCSDILLELAIETAAAETTITTSWARTTIFTWLCNGYADSAAVNFLTIELCNSSFSFFIRRELYETEALRTSCSMILDYRSRYNSTYLRECSVQALIRGRPCESADKQLFCHSNFLYPARRPLQHVQIGQF